MRLAVSCTIASLVVSFAAAAPAATYVDEPAFGHSVSGLAFYAGAPIGGGDRAPSTIGVGGVDVSYGYAWDGGWSLYGVFGFARWSARSSLGDAVADRTASIEEGSAGLALRKTFGDAACAPFVHATLLGELLRVRGANDADLPGLSLGLALGVRWRDAPWEPYVMFDVRRSRLSPVSDAPDAPPLSITRVALVFGVFVDVR